MISALLPQSSAFSSLSYPKLPFRHQRSKDPKLISRLIPRKPLVRAPFRSPSVIKCNVSGRSGQGFRLNDVKEFHPDPFWLSLSKEAFGVLRSLIVFLIEQPSQLRYIEWPSFQSTKSPILVRLEKGAKRPCNAVPVFWGTLKAPSVQVWLPYYNSMGNLDIQVFNKCANWQPPWNAGRILCFTMSCDFNTFNTMLCL